MRGPMQAIALLIATGVMSVILPPISVLTGGIVALVTLRNGAKAGFQVLAGASAILGVIAFFVLPVAGLLVALLVTIGPVWLLAIVLRSTISLSATLNAAVALGAIMVLGMHAAFPDPALWWEELLTTAFEPAMAQGQLSNESFNFAENIKAMSVWMTGLVAAAMTANFIVALLMGRWMQALLYNPGGFKEEFQGLRLSRQLAIATLVALVVGLAVDGGIGSIASDLTWVFGAVFIIQGLSVVHQWVGRMSSPTIWLVVTYALLLFVPQMAVVVALVGLLDTWVNIRARLSKGE